MKSRFFSLLAAICLMVLAAALLPTPAASAASDINADTYYYDHLPAQAQKSYKWLKDYYDKGPYEPGSYYFDFTSWLPTNPSQNQLDQFWRDFLAGDAALKADDPLYQWKGRVSSFSSNEVTFGIDHFDLLTSDIQKRADATSAVRNTAN